MAKTMMELRGELKARGVHVDNFNDEELRGMAKALKIEAPREVKIVQQERGLYAVSEGYKVPNSKKPGEFQTARGFFVRVEAINDMIEDLQIAKGLLEKAK